MQTGQNCVPIFGIIIYIFQILLQAKYIKDCDTHFPCLFSSFDLILTRSDPINTFSPKYAYNNNNNNNGEH